MSAMVLIGRLEGVRDHGRRRWMARCPAHDDARPSLSIRETGEGTVLIHCFAGCGAADVVAAVGLSLIDLFPDGARSHHRRAKRRRQGLPPDEVLEAMSHALTVVKLADCDLRQGKPLNETDYKAVEKALVVLNQARRDAA